MTTHDYTIDLSTANFTIKISPSTDYGYFEHNELGDQCGGGLWFAKAQVGGRMICELYDYDGVEELPKEVATALLSNGYYLDDVPD